MSIYYYLAIIFLSLLFLIFSKNFIDGDLKSLHQKLTTNKIPPLLGGYFIVLVICLNIQISILQKILFFFIFLLGTLSDFKIINSPTSRLILQSIMVLLFLYFSNISLENTRIEFLDFFLTNFYFNLFFCSFSIIILMNGTNFIDGLNGLVSGYYILILLIINKLGVSSNFANAEFINFLTFVLGLLFVMNLFNKIYLGDSGSYLIGFFIGLILIDIYLKNQYLSPFFIILLIWYPCFENLFSISRKFQSKISPLSPDNYHLHQMIFQKILIKTNFQKNLANNFSSTILLAYNCLVILVATQDVSNTKFQIFLILINILFYFIIYIFLRKNKI
tara:strand:+ start:2855 stop:3853 length:999 start_codon:yes stop_codon:yes gene_type:complete